MKKHFIFVAITAIAFTLMACGNNTQNPENVNSADVTTTPNSSEDLGKAFLEHFYQGLDTVFGQQDDYLFANEHLTPKAQQYLLDANEYECPDDLVCMALWLFFYEGGGDVGGNYNRTIEKIDDLTYRVVNNYHSDDGDFNYQYSVKLGLVKDGDTYKIDSIIPEGENDL